MNLPLHLVRIEPALHAPAGAALALAQRTDVQWGRPIFRAPALPSPQQLHNELPFTVSCAARPRHAA
jgi:hypothetical protein